MFTVNTLINMEKMDDPVYIESQVLLSYNHCCIESESKLFILEFICNNISSYIRHHAVVKMDEIFIRMQFPGFILTSKTQFV